jgi:hypothetical protein
MATPKRTPQQARDARRNQRDLAKAIHEGRRNILPGNLKGTAKKSNEAFGRGVIAGRETKPLPGSLEARNLARLASNARHGKASKEFSKFEEYWYHNKTQDSASSQEETREAEEDE